MKARLHLLTALIFSSAPSSWSSAQEESNSSPTRIPGPVSGGKFSPPPPPPPPKEIPADLRIESAVVKTFPSHRLTILRAEPSTLPDIPLPELISPPTAAQLAARESFLRSYRRPIQLQLSATVIDEKFSVVRWRHPQEISVSYEAVVGLDFGLFAGVGNFLHNGTPHSLFLMHSNLNTAGVRRVHPAYQPPAYPIVQEEGFTILKGNPLDSEGIAPLVKLMDLYKIEKERLEKARVERLQAQRDADEWQKKNPVSTNAKSHTFWLRPHRGSRYLQSAQPEGGEQ